MIEPSKRDGKIKEQLVREEKTRREYSKKWHFMNDPKLNQFYEQEYIEEKLKEMVPADKFPKSNYEYTGHGDSYFVSKGMYDPLNLCRCGRVREGTHKLKTCMQSGKIKYSVEEEKEEEKQEKLDTIPRTSNGRLGWPAPGKYLNWEKSTYYYSPKLNVSSTQRVTTQPYSNIILG